MSRKREEQRENRREVARQLGVSGKDVPTSLLENERVTEPRVLPSLAVQTLKRGFLQKPGPMVLHVALYVVDGAGPRTVRQLVRGATLERPGEVSLVMTPAPDAGDDTVRYRRPGHFVVVALLTETPPKQPDDVAAFAKAHATALGNATALRIGLDGKLLAVDDDAIRKVGAARGCALELVTDLAAFTFVAAGVLAIAAVHRVNETVTLPLSTSDQKLVATLSLALRL